MNSGATQVDEPLAPGPMVILMTDGRHLGSRQLDQIIKAAERAKVDVRLCLLDDARIRMAGALPDVEVDLISGKSTGRLKKLVGALFSDDVLSHNVAALLAKYPGAIVHAIGKTAADLVAFGLPKVRLDDVILDCTGLPEELPSDHPDQNPVSLLARPANDRDRWVLLLSNDHYLPQHMASSDSLRIFEDSVEPAAITPVSASHLKDQDPPIVLLSSDLTARAGVAIFAAAARRAGEMGLVARFVLSGRSNLDHPDHVPAVHIKAWEDEGILEWWDRTDQLDALARSSVAVFSCLGQPDLAGLYRAQALGVPIVANDHPDVRRFIRENDNGFIIPAGSERSLIEALVPLIESRQRRVQFGARSRALAEQAPQRKTLEQNYHDLYQEFTKSQLTGT